MKITDRGINPSIKVKVLQRRFDSQYKILKILQSARTPEHLQGSQTRKMHFVEKERHERLCEVIYDDLLQMRERNPVACTPATPLILRSKGYKATKGEAADSGFLFRSKWGFHERKTRLCTMIWNAYSIEEWT